MSTNEIYCRSCGERIKRNAEICPECGVRNAEYDPTAGGQPAGGGGGQGRRGGGGQSRRGGSGPASGGQNASGTQNQRSQSTSKRSEPSSSWAYGVAIGGALWAIVLLLQAQAMLAISQTFSSTGPPPGGAISGGLGSAFLQSPLLLLAWIVLPLSMYFDTKYVSMNSDWSPSKGLYVGIPVLGPVFNVVFFMLGVVVGFNPIFGAIAPLMVVAVVGYYFVQRKDALSEPDTASDVTPS